MSHLNSQYYVLFLMYSSVVLGRPDAGCSTLLRALANQRSEYHAVEGDVFYDSFTPAQIKKHYKGDVQYSPEDDIHFATMTVEQTLRFAAKTRTPANRIDGLSRRDAGSIITEVVLTVLGLRKARNTLIGSASIQGISGGEKKRVSIGEALVSRSLITSWDKCVLMFIQYSPADIIETHLKRNTGSRVSPSPTALLLFL